MCNYPPICNCNQYETKTNLLTVCTSFFSPDTPPPRASSWEASTPAISSRLLLFSHLPLVSLCNSALSADQDLWPHSPGTCQTQPPCKKIILNHTHHKMQVSLFKPLLMPCRHVCCYVLPTIYHNRFSVCVCTHSWVLLPREHIVSHFSFSAICVLFWSCWSGLRLPGMSNLRLRV